MRWVAAIAVPIALFAGLASAQTSDDWDLTVDEAQRLTAASTGYSSGQAIAVRCRAGTLDVLIAGLPIVDAVSRYLELSHGEGPTETGSWLNQAGTVFSATPARTARRLRAGGTLAIATTVDDASDSRLRRYRFELPSQSDAVGRVLQACDAPPTDARDSLPRWPQPRVFPQDFWLRQPTPEYPQAAASAGIESGFAVLSCIVQHEGRLRDCRIEYESDRRGRFGESAVRAMSTARLSQAILAGPVEGQVLNFTIRFQVSP
jgi:TonB family protein